MAKETFIQQLVEKAQKVNRDNWLNATVDHLKTQMVEAAEHGLRGLIININDLVLGAENLKEAAEMLVLLEEAFEDAGFESAMDPEGNYTISW